MTRWPFLTMWSGLLHGDFDSRQMPSWVIMLNSCLAAASFSRMWAVAASRLLPVVLVEARVNIFRFDSLYWNYFSLAQWALGKLLTNSICNFILRSVQYKKI